MAERKYPYLVEAGEPGEPSTEEPIDAPSSTFDGGEPTFHAMSITREELDAKLALSEARIERSLSDMRTELVAIRGDLKTQFASVPSRGFIAVTAIAIVGAVVGALAFGASQFGNGVMVTSVAVQDARDAKRLSEENAAGIQQIKDELGNLVQFFMGQKKTP